MENERNIGRVLNVESFKIVVEIDKENKSLTKTHFTGILPIARINSYVIVPVGFEKIVGHITKVQMFSEASELQTKASITLPDVKRLVWATMIGTLKKDGDNEFYEQGITSYPSLDNPVWFILKEELDCIFDKAAEFKKDEYEKQVKKYYIPVGKSTAFPEYDVKIDPDALFGKHLAVLGNTGSGKSCTIASLIQTILGQDFGGKKVNNAHFIIFDTNGEYSNAFIKSNKEGNIAEKIGDCLTIDREGLKIPYWFMNFEDFKVLFNPSEKTQEPILSTAISISRHKLKEIKEDILFKCFLVDFEAIYEQLNSSDKPGPIKKAVHDLCSNLGEFFQNNEPYFRSKITFFEELKAKIEELKNACPDIQDKFATSGIPTQGKNNFISWYETKINELDKLIVLETQEFVDADKPLYFKKQDLLQSLKSSAKILGELSKNLKINEYLATLKLRINRFFTNDRYDFVFHDYYNFPFALATFLRYCLGRMENAKYDEFDKETNGNKTGKPPFIDSYLTNVSSQRPSKDEKGTNHQIIIFDLSLLASDILENVTALLGRLILEFLQRLGKEKSDRGTFPVVLILEEAHNYIPEKKRSDEKDLISKIVFERIAREGRKFGLSLVVSSQRPSELSKTVLSQCNSFIVHRIQNPEDQRYIQTIAPSINEDLLKQLPALAQRTALIFGDCVRAPAQVYMREADPLPDSKDPKFVKHWLGLDVAEEPDFEKICAEWEGKSDQNVTNSQENNVKQEAE